MANFSQFYWLPYNIFNVTFDSTSGQYSIVYSYYDFFVSVVTCWNTLYRYYIKSCKDRLGIAESKKIKFDKSA